MLIATIGFVAVHVALVSVETGLLAQASTARLAHKLPLPRVHGGVPLQLKHNARDQRRFNIGAPCMACGNRLGSPGICACLAMFGRIARQHRQDGDGLSQSQTRPVGLCCFVG